MREITIRFLEDCEPQDKSGRVFKTGQEITVSHDSAWHWVRRGKAEDVSGSMKRLEQAESTAHALTDKAESLHEQNQQKRGRKVKAEGPNEQFAKGEEG